MNLTELTEVLNESEFLSVSERIATDLPYLEWVTTPVISRPLHDRDGSGSSSELLSL